MSSAHIQWGTAATGSKLHAANAAADAEGIEAYCGQEIVAVSQWASPDEPPAEACSKCVKAAAKA